MTLLELGSGGGNNASHLRERFTCTLSDLSPQMLALSRTLNPVRARRSVTCGRSGSVGRSTPSSCTTRSCTSTSEDNLRACMGTAFAHTSPGGVALSSPTARARPSCREPTRRTTAPTAALPLPRWTTDPHPGDTTLEIDYAVVLHEPGKPSRLVHDHHVDGLFPRAHVASNLLEQAGSKIAAEPASLAATRTARSRSGSVAGRRPHGGARRVDVAPDLRHQLLLGGEDGLVAQALPHLDDEPLAVESPSKSSR